MSRSKLEIPPKPYDIYLGHLRWSVGRALFDQEERWRWHPNNAQGEWRKEDGALSMPLCAMLPPAKDRLKHGHAQGLRCYLLATKTCGMPPIVNVIDVRTVVGMKMPTISSEWAAVVRADADSEDPEHAAALIDQLSRVPRF